MEKNKRNFLHKFNEKVKENKLFVFFFKSKWIFRFPNKKKILIYDGIVSNVFTDYLDEKDFHILFTRGESVNITILLLSFFTRKFEKISFNYYYTYIKYVKPQVIITYVDNDLFFYRFKNHFQDSTTIVVQNGHRGEDFFYSLRNYKKHNPEADYIFVFSENYKKLFSKSIKAKIIVAGSIKNNSVPINKTKRSKSLLFISNFVYQDLYFNFGDRNYLKRKSYSFDEYHQSENQLIPIVAKYCKENNLEFGICAKSNIFDNEATKIEHDYYKSLISIDLKWSFFPSENTIKTFNLIDEFSAIIFIDSYLGYEAMARKKPVAAITIRDEAFKVESGRNFGFPEKLMNQGLFWTNSFDINHIVKIMDFVTNVSQNDWEKAYKEYHDKVAGYDFNNKQLFDLINKKINKNSNLLRS